MCKSQSRLALLLLLSLIAFGISSLTCAGLVKGIYLTQSTMENKATVNYLIKHAKAVGIDTFVVDMEIPSKLYQANIALLKANNIHYVARVVVFPEGGHPDQIASPAYWEKRYHLIQTAVDYGAEQIQLDYIRYNTKQPASSQNAKNIFRVVQWYKDKLKPQGIPLQADVFGISSFGESKHIGQNLRMMAESVDALCPMVYPSHFEPFREHAVTPYETIYKSLHALRSQFDYKMPVKLYAYIEISNYRYPLPGDQRRKYIIAEMKAVRDAGADGYYVWSAHNKYDYLFNLLGELAKNDPTGVLTPAAPGLADKDLLAKPVKTAAGKTATKPVATQGAAQTAEASIAKATKEAEAKKPVPTETEKTTKPSLSESSETNTWLWALHH